MKMNTVSLLSVLLCSLAASAQTAVTTAGGTSGSIPVFSGISSVTNSVITQSGSKVGIGTNSPGYTLDVQGGQVNSGVGVIEAVVTLQ